MKNRRNAIVLFLILPLCLCLLTSCGAPKQTGPVTAETVNLTSDLISKVQADGTYKGAVEILGCEGAVFDTTQAIGPFKIRLIENGEDYIWGSLEGKYLVVLVDKRDGSIARVFHNFE